MKLNELIEELSELRAEIASFEGGTEDEAGESEVFLAYQPNYPLQAGIDSVTAMKRAPGGGRDRHATRDLSPVVVYLGEGGSGNAYAPAGCFDGGFVVDHEDEEEV